MKNTIKILLIVYLSFGIYFILDALYFKEVRTWFYEFTNQFGLSHILAYTLSGIPLFLATLLTRHKKSVWENLGLTKSLYKGLLFSLVCTLPLFIGFSFTFDFNSEISINTIFISVVSAGLFEELYFRGFLFGQVYKNTRLGFFPSVFLGAFFFGLMHLYQSTELAELIGIFSITFIGGILFAWVYAEWNYNLWVPIFLHMLMNLSWELFSVSDNALGSIYSNLLRLLSIALILIGTVWYKKKKKIKLEINKKTIWIKNQAILD